MDPLNPSAQFQVDPELQRIINANSIDFINALCKALPRLAGSLVNGVTIAVRTDDRKFDFQVNIPPGQTSSIIPATHLPQGIRPINGHRF